MREGYDAVLHTDRSVYGVELDIRIPGSPDSVLVAQDVFGEVEERMQILVYPCSADQETERAVSVRINPDGSIAEVVIPEGISVRRWDDAVISDWLERRDGR